MIDIAPYRLRKIQKGKESKWEIFKDQEWASLHQRDLFLLIETAVCNRSGKTIRIQSASWFAYEGHDEVTHDIDLKYHVSTHHLNQETFTWWVESICEKIEETDNETRVIYFFENKTEGI